METVRSRDGTPIAFDRTGEGSPLILVGGALSDRNAAAALAARLADRCTVIAYDRRGRGDSGDTLPYAVDRELEDLAALIDTVGGSAAVFGHSSGAALALRAVIRGAAVTRLAVYEPPFIVDDARPPLPGDYVKHLEELVDEGRPGDAVTYFMITGVGVPAPVVEQMRGSPMWAGMEALAHTIVYDVWIMGEEMAGRPLPGAWASQITIPTLVLDGGDSPNWQRHATAALASLMPSAEHRTLEGQDHGADPEILAPILAMFLDGGPDPTGV
jgi:pimeloyl-ACP methyl ester carboxylesterase